MIRNEAGNWWWNFKGETIMGHFKLLSKQWIVDENNNIIIGEGRSEILELVESTGSLNQVAKLLKMSYKAVWGKIKATERAMNVTIVDTDRKLGSHLTKEGKELLAKYNRLKKECLAEDDKIFKSIFEKETPKGD
jgi:molybdate transport system regulatory protein